MLLVVWCWTLDLATTTAAATVWTNTPNCELSWLLRKTDSQFWFHPWIIITCSGFKMIKKITLKSFNSIHYPFSAWELQHEFCPYSAPLTVCVQHRYHKQRFKSNFWQIDFVLDIVKVWQCQWWFTASWWPGWHWPVCRPLETGGHGLTELREKLRHQV